MATSWVSVDVGCPFYKASDGLCIRCEAIASVSVTMIFTARQKKIAFLERYCNCRWIEYKAIVDKYG